MKTGLHYKSPASRSGIALIMVLMVITVLGVIAFGFAKSMSVEVKLARNASFDTEMEWLGRSGVEAARWVLAEHLTIPNEGNYDALYQYWAGGPYATNEVLNAINFPLQDIQIGAGKVSLKIIDLERFYNINLADETALRLAMDVAGVDPTLAPELVDCIIDWRDTDDATMLNGAESDYYLSLSPPYMAKDGPIDDLEELLRIKGVTPEIFYGPGATNGGALPSGGRVGPPGTPQSDVIPVAGLKDMFTPISARVINPRTAPREVLLLIPGIDPNTVDNFLQRRRGPDGLDGNEDDFLYQSLPEILGDLGLIGQGAANATRLMSQRSATFQVTVTATLNGKQREMVAVLRRNDQRDVKVLMQYWK